MSTSRVVPGVTALIVAYFLVTAGVNAVRSHQLGSQEDQLRAEIREMQAHYDRLTALNEYVQSDEYIESSARELGLVGEGEIGFVAFSTQPTPTPGFDDVRPELWWDVLIR